MIFTYPNKRPGIITSVYFSGEDDDLQLTLEWAEDTRSGATTFQLQNIGDGNVGQICLPASAQLEQVSEDAIIASIRMAAFISNSTAGSGELADMFADQEGSRDIQSAVGNLKVDAVRTPTGVCVELDIKKKNSQQKRTICTDHGALSQYSYTPSTQLLVVAGAIRAEYPSYVHDYPDAVLTQSQRDDIIAYIMTLAPWV